MAAVGRVLPADFLRRYGLYVGASAPWAEPSHVGMRHSGAHRATGSGCEPTLRFRCVCPGPTGTEGCCEAITDDDRLCDDCRRGCHVLTSPDGVLVPAHRLLGGYEWAGPSSAFATAPAP